MVFSTQFGSFCCFTLRWSTRWVLNGKREMFLKVISGIKAMGTLQNIDQEQKKSTLEARIQEEQNHQMVTRLFLRVHRSDQKAIQKYSGHQYYYAIGVMGHSQSSPTLWKGVCTKTRLRGSRGAIRLEYGRYVRHLHRTHLL